MILVDELMVWPHARPPFHLGSCHLTTITGSLDDLHAFARRLGLRRAWFQDHPIAPHYDLTPSRRERALLAGATFMSARAQVVARRHAKRLATSPEGEP